MLWSFVLSIIITLLRKMPAWKQQGDDDGDNQCKADAVVPGTRKDNVRHVV